MRIFGREPALWLALAASVISGIGTFVVHLNIDQEGALNGVVAAIIGLVVWKLTSDGGPALILGFVKALIVLAAAFHFNMSTDRQTILMTLVSAVVAMFVRTQVGAPVPPPAATASPVVVVDKPVL
jgi:hypothetical protein